MHEDVGLVHELPDFARHRGQHPFDFIVTGDQRFAVAQEPVDLIDAGSDRQHDVGDEPALILARRQLPAEHVEPEHAGGQRDQSTPDSEHHSPAHERAAQ